MANVSDKVAQIRQAVYGKDVRESIASGIEAINDETESTTARQTSLETIFNQLIINAGNSNAEIVASRYDGENNISYSSLPERLDNINASLNRKAEQSNLAATDTTVVTLNTRVSTLETKKIGQNDITDELRQQIAGTAPINAVPADKSLTYQKFADNVTNDILNSRIKINLMDEIVYGGQALNGAVFNNNTITVPIGSTGNTAWRRFEFYLNQYNRINRLQGKAVRVELTLKFTNADLFKSNLGYNMHVFRSSEIQNVAVNKSASAISTDIIKYSMDYTITSTDVSLRPYIQLYNTTPVSGNNAVIELLSLNFSVIDNTQSLNGYNTDNLSEYVAKKEYDTLIINNIIKDNYSPTWRYQLFNGAIITDNTLTIPAGNTGNTSWFGPSFAVTADSYGRTIRIEFLVTVSANLMGQISALGAQINVIRNGNVITNIGANVSLVNLSNLSNNVYKFTGDYTVIAGDTEIRPYIQISNNKGALVTTEIVSITETCKYYTSVKQTIITPQTIQVSDMINARTIVTITKTVKPDGTGDYLSPKLANDAITDASPTKIYNIIVYPGVYTEVNWTLKPYINLIGIDREICWLKGELPDDADDTAISSTSTINLNGTNTLENLKITCRNMRYPVHDESSGTVKDWIKRVRNCHIEHYGNDGARDWRNAHPESGLLAQNVWTSEHAWGYGSSSGAIAYFEDTTFIAPYSAWYMHNREKFSKPCIHYLTNCRMIATKPDRYAIRIQSLGSGTNDRVYMNNCELNGLIRQDDSPWIPSEDAYQYANHADIKIIGSGNTPVPFINNHRGLAFRIISANTVGKSTVRVEGSAVNVLFGDVQYKDMDGGLQGYAYGNLDISGIKVGLNADIDAKNTIGRRLGDCSINNLTLTVIFNDTVTKTIIFNQNYTAMTNADILASINAILAPDGMADEFWIAQKFYVPMFLDQIIDYKNTSNVGIPNYSAVCHNTSYYDIRLMKSSDDVADFVGIALDDIPPGGIGRIQVKGYIKKAGVVFGDKLVINPSKDGEVIVNNSASSYIARGKYTDYYGYGL